MKKRLAGALLLSVSLVLPQSAALARTQPMPRVEIDGRVFTDELVQIERDRLQVPLRAVAEAIGATVHWSPETQSITMTRDGRQTVMRIGAATAQVNGQTVRLDTPPRVIHNRTIVPYRFVGESLGAIVGWDERNRTAFLWAEVAEYVVQPGDTLSLIAGRYHMTLQQVRQLNNLTSDHLVVGDRLRVRLLQSGPAVPAPFQTVSGYTVVASWNDLASVQSVQANGQQLTDIATVSHRLRANGTIWGSPQGQAMAAAHQQGLQSWLVVKNLDDTGNFSREIVEQFLRDHNAWNRFIDEVTVLLERHGFTGVEIDFEDIAPESRPYLTGFMKELSAAVQGQGRQVSIAVPAKTGDFPKAAWSGAYDYVALGQVADRVVIMAYDEHWFGGPAGPIASLPWVERVLRYATQAIPPKKLLLGVPGYAYDWPVAGGNARSIPGAQAQQMALVHGWQWNEAASSPSFIYEDATGQQRVVWYENDRSLGLKIDVARQYGVGGIAIWRLGIEGGAIWSALGK